MTKKRWWEVVKSEMQNALTDAAQVFVLEKERSGLTLFVALTRMGWRGWGWLFLLSLTFSSVLALGIPHGDTAAMMFFNTPVGSGILACWIPLLWTLLVVTTSDFSPILRLLVTLYSLYFWALPPLTTLSPQILFVPVTALFLYECMLENSSMRIWLGRIMWALLLATFLPDPLPNPWISLLFKTTLGVVLGTLPFWYWFHTKAYVRALFLWISLTFPYWLAWAQEPTALVNGIKQSLQGMWTFTVPIWLWLGAGFVEECEKQGWFLGRRLLILSHSTNLSRVLPVLLVLIGVVLIILLFPIYFVKILPIQVVTYLVPLWSAVREWSPETYFWACMSAFLLFPLGFLGIWMGRRDEPANFLPRYTGLVVGVVVFWFAFWQNYFGAPGTVLPEQFWPLLLILVGWLWEPIKGIRELTGEVEDKIEWSCALALILITMVGTLWIWERNILVNLTTVTPLMGILAWGLPYLLARIAWALRGDEGHPFSLIKPFMAGYVTMLLLTGFTPWLGHWQNAVAFFLTAGLLPSERHNLIERWLQRLQIGLGIVAFQVFPWIVPLPIPVSFTQVWLERLYTYSPLPFLEQSHLVSMGIALIAGLPAVLFVAENRLARWIEALVGAVIWRIGVYLFLGG